MLEAKVKAGIELVAIRSKADVRATLLDMYPEGRIPADKFLANLNKVDQSVLKSLVGVDRTFYGIDEIADLIWDSSNYELSEAF